MASRNGTQCCAYNCSKRRKTKQSGTIVRSDSEGSEDDETVKKRQFPRTFHRYLCSVLHEHGPQSASGEIFQNEIKALKENHKKLLSKSGGLASFLLQSDNVLLREPDILFLEADTLTTVIPVAEHHPLQLNPLQVSATGESLSSNTRTPPSLLQKMSASGYNDREECVIPSRNNQINESASNLQNPVSSADVANTFSDATDPELVGAQAQNPNNVSACADDPSASLMGIPKLDFMEDKKEVNISDQSSSEFDFESSSSSWSSDHEKETERSIDFFFSYSEGSRDSLDSSGNELPSCESCERSKPRLEFLEQEYRNSLAKYEAERRNRELAEQKVSSLEAQLEALQEENTNLIKIIEGSECLQSSEASNMPRAVTPKSLLRTGRRSLPPHLKGPSKQSPSLKTEEDTTTLCVICHENLVLFTANSTTLQCGHVFHDTCIRKWLVQQKTCPSCRKHTLLPEEFPPLA